MHYDGYHRKRQRGERWSYPFPQRIDWQRVVVEAAFENASSPQQVGHALLDTLLAMPQQEIDARLSYLRKIAPLLMFGDWRGGHGGQGQLFDSSAHVVPGYSAHAALDAKGAPLLDAAQLVVEALEERFLTAKYT